MDTDEETWGSPAEIAEELHHAMRYANDLIKRAAHAGLTVEVYTLNMYRAGGVIPQIDFAVRQDEAGVIALP